MQCGDVGDKRPGCSQEDPPPTTSTNWKKIGLVVGVGAAGAVAAPLAVPVVVGALGFGTGGIAAGSTAAWMMSLYGGATTAGGVVATLQSVGAAGLGVAGTIGFGGAGALGGGAAAAKLYEQMARSDLLDEARKAIQEGKHDHFREVMGHVVEQSTKDLSSEAHNLLSKGYGNIATYYIDKLKALKSDEDEAANLHAQVEKLTNEFCKLIDKLFTSASDPASEVLYQKMKGDYLSRFAKVKKLSDTENIKKSYDAGYNIAKSKLPATDPLRLKLACNMSVFYHDVLHEKEKACAIANEALRDARAVDNNTLSNESAEIIQQLSSNLSLWNNELESHI